MATCPHCKSPALRYVFRVPPPFGKGAAPVRSTIALACEACGIVGPGVAFASMEDSGAAHRAATAFLAPAVTSATRH